MSDKEHKAGAAFYKQKSFRSEDKVPFIKGYLAACEETQEQLEALKAENESHKSDLKEGVNLMRELEVQNEILETEIESLKAENETQNKTVQEWIKTNRFLADNGTFELWAIEEADIPELITLIKAESLKADKAKVEAEKTCQWELDSNADYETWETSCGRSWCFEGESDLKEHGVVFCQGCGGRVIDASQLETKEGN